MGVDLGSRRIGVAVSDSAAQMAFPKTVVERTGDPAADRRRLAALAAELEARTIVVGLPLSLDGREGPAARAALAEAEALRRDLESSGVEVTTFDERLTTVEADRALSDAGKDGRARRRVVDSAAAAVLLQAWLDAR